jgi:hypothetical protein
MFKAQLQEIFWTIVREQWEDMERSFESVSRHDRRFWPYLFATVSETAGQHSGGRELSGPLLSILVPAVRQETRQEILIELAAWPPPPPLTPVDGPDDRTHCRLGDSHPHTGCQ